MSNLNDGVFDRMTDDERNELMLFSFAGPMKYDSNGDVTVMMGMEAMNRMRDYEKQMNEKYGK